MHTVGRERSVVQSADLWGLDIWHNLENSWNSLKCAKIDNNSNIGKQERCTFLQDGNKGAFKDNLDSVRWFVGCFAFGKYPFS